MKWLRLLVVVCLAAVAVCALALVVVLGPGRERATDLLRRELETLLTSALHTPVSIGALRVFLAPPHVEADAVAIGEGGALASAAHVVGTLAVRASLRQVRPVATASADGVSVDVPGWIALLDVPDITPPTKPPPFRLDAVHVRDVWVRIAAGPEPLAVQSDAVSGTFDSDVLGRFGITATALPVVLTRGGTALPLQRAAGAVTETLSGFHLSALDVVGDGVQLAGETQPGSEDLAVRGSVDLAKLAWVDEALQALGGRAELDAVLAGPLDAPSIAGTVRVSTLSVDGDAIGDVTTRAAVTRTRLTVDALHLAGPAGEADASGELQLEGRLGYTAQLRWSSLDVRRVARLSDGVLKACTADGRADLTGTLTPLTVQGSGDGTIVATQGGTPITWTGRAHYTDAGGSGELEAEQGTSNSVHGRLAIAAGGALDGGVAVAVADPGALGALLPIETLPNLRGTLTASARISGRRADPRVDGEVDGRNVLVLGAAIDRLSGSFSADRSAVRVAALHADLQPGSVDASGTIGLDSATRNDFEGRVAGVSGDTLVAIVYALTGQVAPIGRGTIAAQVRGRGPWSALELQASAAMQEFWLSKEWIQRAGLEATATWPRWSGTAELSNRTAQRVTVRAAGTGTADVAFDAHSDGWQLTALQRGDVAETGGVITLDAHLRGPLLGLSGNASVQMLDLVLGGRRFGTIDAALDASRGRWQMRATALDGTVQLRGTVAADPGWPFTLAAEWNEARLGRLIQPGADVWVVSSGTADAKGRLNALDQVEAAVDVTVLRVINGPYRLDLTAPARVQCRRGTCVLDALELRGTNTQVRASGQVTSGGTLRLSLTGDGDLRLLELLGPPIASARGRFTADADIRRQAGRWDVGGQIALDQVGLDVGAPVAITRTTGRVSLQGTTLHIDQLGGRIGTGSFAVGGAIDLQRGPAITWTLTDVGADPMPSMEAELSGEGVVDGTWEQTRVKGEIRVARLLYDRDFELTDILPSFNQALAAAPRPPSAHPIILDIRVIAPGELYVENNLARVEAAANLRITGTAAHPIVDGRVELLDGEITFRDRMFEVQGGTVDFRPDLGLTPALNLTAESTIDTPDATYTVAVRITGTTADPRVALSSDDPALSQTDIATLIAVGKTTAQLREGGGGFSMYDALAIVPKQLTQPVAQGAQRLLPIDRITFEPTFSRTTGTFEPQLKLGKDLTDNLAVSVGQTFGVESRTTAEADYRLSPHVFIPLSWESQTQTQEGAFAGGVKLRYEFWRLTPYTLLRTLRR